MLDMKIQKLELELWGRNINILKNADFEGRSKEDLRDLLLKEMKHKAGCSYFSDDASYFG